MNLKKTIFLARHGMTVYNEGDLLQGRIDLPLSDRGRKEAEQLAEALQDEKLDIIYHSPLARARQTADIINRCHHLEQRVIEAFSEIDMGDWEGLNYFEMMQNNQEFYRAWMKDPQMALPGGESFIQVFNRVKPGVEEIMASDFNHILIVGHASVNRGILGVMLDLEPEPSRMFRMKNCAYSKLLVYENGKDMYTVVESWNNSTHLEGSK